MVQLNQLRQNLYSQLQAYSRTLRRAVRFVKIVLFIGGAAVASVGLAIDVAHANRDTSPWTVAGLIGAVLVAIAAIFDAIRETDAADALAEANRAIDAAAERQRALDELFQEHGRFDTAIMRGLELYVSMDVMRGVIEQSLSVSSDPLARILQNLLDAPGDSLMAAFGFEIKDIWTICIFMAQPAQESGKTQLRCVAHLRKIPCEIDRARVWPEGVGVAGIAYSTSQEIIIENMAAPENDAIFRRGTYTRDYDALRYVSMVAAPITVGADPKPWGVAVVTSDRINHFTRGSSYGIATAEPIRAIAAMTALAVKAEGLGRRHEALPMAKN